LNERITQLAEQAGAETWSRAPMRAVTGLAFTDENLEKFADMIVRECMRQVEEQYKPVLEDEIMMKDTHWDGYVQCGVDSVVAIREHFFGVK
jgi:hypothetical protein